MSARGIRQMAVDTPCVPRPGGATRCAAQLAACGVVCPDGLPCKTEALDLLRENPRSHINIGAGIMKLGLADTQGPERLEVRGVHLHEADVDRSGLRAVRSVDRVGTQSRLALCDGVEQIGAHAVARSSLLPARVYRRRQEATTQRQGHKVTPHNSLQIDNTIRLNNGFQGRAKPMASQATFARSICLPENTPRIGGISN